MPNSIANFISRFVYDGRLRSQHEIFGPGCVAFINAPATGEERAGFSSKVILIATTKKI